MSRLLNRKLEMTQSLNVLSINGNGRAIIDIHFFYLLKTQRHRCEMWKTYWILIVWSFFKSQTSVKKYKYYFDLEAVLAELNQKICIFHLFIFTYRESKCNYCMMKSLIMEFFHSEFSHSCFFLIFTHCILHFTASFYLFPALRSDIFHFCLWRSFGLLVRSFFLWKVIMRARSACRAMHWLNKKLLPV